MLSTSYNATESRYPYKICPQKAPVKLLHEIRRDSGLTPIYHGTITFSERRLENIIAFKVNMLYLPSNAGEAIPAGGRIKLLLSQKLGTLVRTNQFFTSTSTTTGTTEALTASNIIAYTDGGTNPYNPAYVNTFDNNRVIWFNQPEQIHYFDWQVLDLITAAEPQNADLIDVCFEIEFFYSCDCYKRQ